MTVDISTEDRLLIVNVLQEKNNEYQDQILTGYTDKFTALDTLKELEEKQKRIISILNMLGEL